MSEAPDKRKEALVDAATKLHDYNAFLASPQMRELSAELQESMDALQQELLTPMLSMEDALKKNLTIGKIMGMLAMSLNAETKRSAYQDAHDKLVKEITDAAKRSGSPSGAGNT